MFQYLSSGLSRNAGLHERHGPPVGELRHGASGGGGFGQDRNRELRGGGIGSGDDALFAQGRCGGLVEEGGAGSVERGGVLTSTVLEIAEITVDFVQGLSLDYRLFHQEAQCKDTISGRYIAETRYLIHENHSSYPLKVGSLAA